MNSMGKSTPSATKNHLRQRYVLDVFIIMKNSAIMNAAVSALAICKECSGCMIPRKDMNSDHRAMGNVSSSALLKVLGGVFPANAVHAASAINPPSREHGHPGKQVIQRDQDHCHSRHEDNGYISPYAAKSHKWHEPESCGHKKHRKKEQCGSNAAQLCRAQAGRHKRWTQAHTRQEPQDRRSRHPVFSNAADTDQPGTRASVRAAAPYRPRVPQQRHA